VGHGRLAFERDQRLIRQHRHSSEKRMDPERPTTATCKHCRRTFEVNKRAAPFDGVIEPDHDRGADLH
jgi:hypothetical protein